MDNHQKSRITILDGLRGVAALFVVSYHLLETFYSSDEHIINHGYLAVDFFFLLSGFVLSYAYNSLWTNGMSYAIFIKKRLIRLHPLVILATVLGLMSYLFQSSSVFPNYGSANMVTIIFVAILNIFFIPTPKNLDIRGWGELFCLNSPQWTLGYEYIANIAYAFFLRRITTKLLIIFTAFSIIGTLLLTLNIDVFGVLDCRDQLAYTVIGGWCLTISDFTIALTRLCFPFCCGMLIYRLKLKFQTKNPMLVATTLLSIVFLIPKIQGIWNGIYEFFCIVILFPFIIIISTSNYKRPANNLSERIYCFLGNYSYPLYLLHFPIVYLQISWVYSHPNATKTDYVLCTLISLFMILIISFLAMKFYDNPLRRYLNKRIIKIETQKTYIK